MVANPLDFSQLNPDGSVDRISNPMCGGLNWEQRGSEIHLFLKVRYTKNSGQFPLDETVAPEGLQLVSIALGSHFRIVLGFKLVQIFRLEQPPQASDPGKLIFQQVNVAKRLLSSIAGSNFSSALLCYLPFQ